MASELSAQNLCLGECLSGVGITNQRETTVVWDKESGTPLHPAIIWSDARTQITVQELLAKQGVKDKDHLRDKCGLPLSTYFSAVKVKNKKILTQCSSKKY